MALAREGRAVSLSHDVPQEKAADTPTFLDRALVTVAPNVSLDRYQYTGTYHGVVHSHLDAVDCHIMVDGKGYNGVSVEEIKAAGGCPRGSINALKDGVVTRAILFDATRLPGKATPQGWLEPGTAIHREDLEALERTQRVKVSPGDVILLYTGRWKRRAALGPWPNATGFAGYHIDVAYFPQGARRLVHRRRWAERCLTFRPATGRGTPPACARGHGRQHLRQPRLRKSC